MKYSQGVTLQAVAEAPAARNSFHVSGGNLRISPRCRLDRASSPPPALKLVAMAAAEVRDVFTDLIETLDQEAEECERDQVYASEVEGDGERARVTTQFMAPTMGARDYSGIEGMLNTIVRNCRFLLKCPRPRAINLAR